MASKAEQRYAIRQLRQMLAEARKDPEFMRRYEEWRAAREQRDGER